MPKRQNKANPCEDIASNIRAAITQHAKPSGSQIGSHQIYHEPSGEEARYLWDMSRLLCGEYSESKSNKHPDIVSQIAELVSPEDVVRHIKVSSTFMIEMRNALGSSDHGYKCVWPEEIEHAKELIRILKIHNALDKQFGDVCASEVNFRPRVAANLNNQLEDGVCVYKAAPFSEHWESKKEHPIEPVEKPLDAKDNRPKLFFFGGAFPLEETQGHIEHNIRYIRTTLDTDKIPHDAYDIYNVTYHNRAALGKWQDTLEYSTSPATHVSKEAAAFTEQFLRPLYAKGKGKNATAGYNDAELKHRFSLITFVGYSYGAVFIRELCNAMQQDMKNLGYSAVTIKKTLPAIASFGLASTGKLDPEIPHHFTQTHINAKEDLLSITRSNIKSLVDKTPRTKHVREFRAGDKEGLKCVAIEVDHMPTQLNFYPPSNTISLFDDDKHSFAVTDQKGEKRRFAKQPVYSLNNSEYHHIGSFITTSGIRHCDGILGISPNPATHFIAEAFRAQVAASVDAAKTPDGKRNSEAILKEITERTLSPDALRVASALRSKYERQLGGRARNS